jgi:ribonuclease HI
MLVKITTDGSVLTNPGPGGWACIFRANGVAKSLYGFDSFSTNNQMELMAAIRGLEHLSRPCSVELHSDSEYVVNGITMWIKKWKKNGWIAGDWVRGAKINTPAFSMKSVKNKELWLRLDEATKRHRILWKHVKGHATDPDNLLCDQIARRAAHMQITGSAIVTDVDMTNIVQQAKKNDEQIIRTISFQDV